MNPKHRMMLLPVIVPVLLLLAAGCSTQKNDTMDTAEQAPPPPAAPDDSQMAGATAPEPPPPAPERKSTAATHPQRTRASQATGSIPEERSSESAPQAPALVTYTMPAGTSLAVNLNGALSSENAVAGDRVRATLKSPVIVGDRVIFPAGSVLDGQVSDVKSAKKGFKDTGGALSIQFHHLTAPDGHSASISAGFTKVATGSAGKKAGIIGGSAVGGAILGKLLGKDAKGGALVGGAVGTAVAGTTKGREAGIQPDEEIKLSLEKSAQTSMRP
jgi:hypothetical protein